MIEVALAEISDKKKAGTQGRLAALANHAPETVSWRKK
jgi:hypothetical protein